MAVQDAVEDTERVLFFQEALDALRRAVKEGVNLKGCMAWSKCSLGSKLTNSLDG